MAVKIPVSTIPQVKSGDTTQDSFLAGLLAQCQSQESVPQWLSEMRLQSQNWLSGLSVPTRRDEDWRFIDLAELTAGKFVTNNNSAATWQAAPEASKTYLVFVNGVYSPEQSDVSGLPEGVFVGNLANLPEGYDLAPYFAQQPGVDTFTALNTAGCNDLAIIWVESNITVSTPIQVIYIADGEQAASFTQPRTLVVANPSSSINLIEEFVGTGEYFTNAVSEIFVQNNAQVNHTRLQQESAASYHIGKTAVSQQRDSHYTLNEINLGAKLMRHSPELWQQGAQTESNLNGLTVATGVQTSDTHSIIALTQPQGISNQLHKCIVSDRAHTVFNGKVFVPKEAQMTDATQLNRNLMLSAKARVDTKPELQITADNVKCAHGATVSQLEAEEIFYLRSRGLSEVDANQLLIDAFAAEIIERLPLESLSSRISQTIEQQVQP